MGVLGGQGPPNTDFSHASGESWRVKSLETKNKKS